MTTATQPDPHRMERCSVCRCSSFGSVYSDKRKRVECKHCHKRFEAPTPKVGDGATYGIGSDSYPYTVSRVSASGKTIWLQADGSRATKDSDYYGNQSYIFTPNPDAPEQKATLRKDGYYRFTGQKCGYISIGHRSKRLDPSF